MKKVLRNRNKPESHSLRDDFTDFFFKWRSIFDSLLSHPQCPRNHGNSKEPLSFNIYLPLDIKLD